MTSERYLKTKEAAAYLRIDEKRLRDLVNSGAIPARRQKAFIFDRLDLDAWAAREKRGVVVDFTPRRGRDVRLRSALQQLEQKS